MRHSTMGAVRIGARAVIIAILATLLLCGASACAPAGDAGVSEESSSAVREATQDIATSDQDAVRGGTSEGAPSVSDARPVPDAPSSDAIARDQEAQDEAAPVVQAPVQPSTISVYVSVDSSRAASSGYPSSMGSATVSLPEGASAYDALRALGVSVGGSSGYVSSINGLAEFACGPASGWMYSVNGSFPGQSAGSCKLHAADSVCWVYTLDFGNDV